MLNSTSLEFIVKVDSKGRISIPIRIRVKLKMLEGSLVKIVEKEGYLLLFPLKKEAEQGDYGEG
ncbi:MAG: MraZ N-terminal domain containing protein [Candidatus Aenigmarchaeota archaeon]|nr:MraZ N-terminal domain containing protein [Candidatus Aenigmarchaeota archaeon]